MALASSPIIERSQEGDTVDGLVDRVVGRGVTAVEAVLAANPGLARHGVFLPAGVAVVIPADAAAPHLEPLVQLWS